MTVRVYKHYLPPVVRWLVSRRCALIRTRWSPYNMGRTCRAVKL